MSEISVYHPHTGEYIGAITHTGKYQTIARLGKAQDDPMDNEEFAHQGGPEGIEMATHDLIHRHDREQARNKKMSDFVARMKAKRPVKESVNESSEHVKDDIDYDGGLDTKKKHEEEFGVKITRTNKPHALYSHDVSGPKANVGKFLINHYESKEDAMNIHPKIFESVKESVNESSESFISATVNEDPVAAQNIFQSMLASKISSLIDAKRQEVGSSMMEGRERTSSSFQFTHTPGDEDSEKKLADLKASVKGTNKRVVLQGRLGKNNPNAHKYSAGAPEPEYKDGKATNRDVTGKSGVHSHQRIQNADAHHFDVYTYNK